MNLTLKKFIESNIDLIDKNDVKGLLEQCPYYLIPDLIEMLEEAHVETSHLKQLYRKLDDKLSNSQKLSRLTEDNLILSRLTKRDLDYFDIYPYNSFSKPQFYSIDSGNSQQVVFAIDMPSGSIYIEEDTDRVGVKTTYDSPQEFVTHYRQLTKTL